MAGKKKSLANRLAKMSDEERARYLQRKADLEEEARRRKEQLISIFMKNKIKREDGFSRLNLAKINQQWHQILRQIKCQEMKEDIEHMKKNINRVVDYKNRTIEKLLEELEMAEEQYANNFQSHLVHIDQTMDSHEGYMKLMNNEFDSDLNQLLETTSKEHKELIEKSSNQVQHLKTIIFTQNHKSQQNIKNDKESFLKKKEELSSCFHLKLDAFVGRSERHCAALWGQIAAVVKAHVARTDTRRLHLAELKRLDAESAAEIASNQERIRGQEEEIKKLQLQYEQFQRSQTVENLKKKLEAETSRFLTIRTQFRKAYDKSNKQLTVLSHESTKSIAKLESVKSKGQQLLTLTQTCRKFETDRDQVKFLAPLPEISIRDEELDAIKRKRSASGEMVKKVVISVKGPNHLQEQDLIKREFALLDAMEPFWNVYNRVDLELRETKQEKRLLLEQNKHFRGMIRAVLEAAALGHSTPDSKVPTRVASKRAVKSAPLKRILI